MEEGTVLRGPTRSGPRSGLTEAFTAVVMISVGSLLIYVDWVEPGALGGKRWLTLGGAVAVLVALGAAVELVRNFKRRRRAAEGGRDAWLADFDWPADGLQRANTWGEAVRAAAVVLGSLLPGAGILLMSFSSGFDEVWMPVLGVAMAAGMGAAVWYQLGAPLVQCLRHGESRLRMPPVPVYLGQPSLVEFETAAALGALGLTLRCVREAWEGSGKHRRKVRHFVQRGRAETHSQTTNGFQLLLEPPADAPGTSLGVDPPTYWELEVVDEAAGFEALFLVPVYPRPVLG